MYQNIACFSEYDFATLKQQMKKQYSTQYLPEKYKQRYLIDIYNFEIKVLKNNTNTVHRATTKIVV